MKLRRENNASDIFSLTSLVEMLTKVTKLLSEQSGCWIYKHLLRIMKRRCENKACD